MRYLTVLFFCVIPKAFLSRLFGYAARIRIPSPVLRFLIRRYCSAFKVNTGEMSVPAKGFATFDEFFTRKLKPGARPVDQDSAAVVSPVDGRIDQFGEITDMRIIQAKGIDFGLCDLVPEPYCRMFENGAFMTVYLSPGDYHRIHCPVDGSVEAGIHIPGKLFPVSECLVNGIRGLFTKNERLITFIKTGFGVCAVCKIGAMNVGRISVDYWNVETNHSFLRTCQSVTFSSHEDHRLKKGDSLGIFHLGSTVVLLFPRGSIEFERLCCGQKIQVGQKIGRMKKKR